MKNLEFFKDIFPGGNVTHSNEKIITRKKRIEKKGSFCSHYPVV